MRFIHCADLHLGIRKYGTVDIKTGLCSRIKEDLEQFDRVVNSAIKWRCNLFLIAGDVFDKRKPDEIVQREFAKRVKTLINSHITVVILIGNHEGITAMDTAHCFSSIQELNDSRYLWIVDHTKVIELESFSLLIACLPYYDDKVFTGFLLKKGYNAILLGHALIKGAKQGEFRFKTGMHPLSFKHEQFVYKAFGHIHQHQTVGNIVYSGSINRINFGDEGIQKGFMKGVIDHDECTSKFVKLSSRQFLTINTVWGQGVKKAISKYDINDTIVKVNIKDKKGNAEIPILNIKRFLSKKGAIIDSVNIIRETNEHVRDKTYQTDLSPYKMLKHYLKAESKSVIKKGIKILKRIKQ